MLAFPIPFLFISTSTFLGTEISHAHSQARVLTELHRECCDLSVNIAVTKSTPTILTWIPMTMGWEGRKGAAYYRIQHLYVWHNGEQNLLALLPTLARLKDLKKLEFSPKVLDTRVIDQYRLQIAGLGIGVPD